MNHIHSALFENARKYPKRFAIMSPTVDPVDYETLARIVATYARRLQLRGVDRSSRLAVNLSGGISVIAIAYAASIIGCRWAQVDKYLLDHPEIITFTHQVHDNIDQPVDKDHVIYVDTWRDDADIFPEELPQFGLQSYVGKKAIWRVVNSSGSTGVPKFMELTEEIIQARCQEPLEFANQAHPKIGLTFPSYASPGLITLLRILTAGGTAIVRPTIPYLIAEKADFVIGSLSQLVELMRNEEPSGAKVPLAIATGGLLTATFVKRSLEFFGGVVNRLGSTETGHIASSVIREISEGPFPVGTPDRDTDVEIVDELGQRVGINMQGRIRIKKPEMVSRYLGNSAEQNASFADGWFYSGDLGYFSHDGKLYLTGRAKEQFNLGGVKLSADVIDEKLIAVDGIRDCVSFTMSDEHGINRLYAALVLEAGVTPDEAISKIATDYAAKAAPPEIPDVVYFVPKAPRNENGKATRHLAAEFIRGLTPWPVKSLFKASSKVMS